MARARTFWKSTLIGWLTVTPVWFALVYVDQGKGAAFMKTHLWLTCFDPLLLLFLILFVRSYYYQYK